MAIAVNNIAGNTGILVSTIDVTISVAAGHEIIVIASCEDEGTTNTLSVSDDKAGGTNTYTEVVGDHSSVSIPRGYMWKTSAASPGAITKVTITASTTCNICAYVLDVTGASNSTAAESFQISHGTSTALSSGVSVGTPSTGDLVVGFGTWISSGASGDTSPQFTPANGSAQAGTTNVSEFADQFIRVNLRVQALVITGTSTQTFQSTIASLPWTAGVAMFKAGAFVPDAPTIGTATPGNVSGSVTFSAPGSDGGSAITSYTVTCTSSNGGVAGSNSGAGSPIVVSGLSPGKLYTATVKATNAIGDSPASAASNSFVPHIYFRPSKSYNSVRRSTSW